MVLPPNNGEIKRIINDLQSKIFTGVDGIQDDNIKTIADIHNKLHHGDGDMAYIL